MSFTNFLVLHVFTALLPPVDNDERDYYECLGLPKGGGAHAGGGLVSWMKSLLPKKSSSMRTQVTSEDIRKAYKAKSLELHPDKVAQRRQMNAEEAAAEYERVQEAYACLSDNKNRQEYHQLKCSIVRYKFVHGGMAHPAAFLENLQRSNCTDKTRLVFLVDFAILCVLLQPILIATKVNQSLKNSGSMDNVSWAIVLIPLWIFYAFNTFFWISMIFIVEDNQARKLVICSLLQNTCWLAGFIVLALAWDHGLALQILEAKSGLSAMPSTSWHILAIPFYLALVFRIIDHSLVMSMMRMEQAKCVTPEKFAKIQQEHPSNVSGEEAEAERLAQLEDEYTVVTIPEEAVAETLEAMRKDGQNPAAVLNDDEMEFLRVSHSPEYEAISTAIQEKRRAIGSILLFGFPFVAIVACKLQGQISASWWICFLPIWINLGTRLIFSCCMCCFASLPSAGGSDLVVVTAPQQRDEEGGSSTESKSTVAKDSSEKQSTSSASDAFKASSTKWAPVEGSVTEFETGSNNLDSKATTTASLNNTDTTSAAGSGSVQVEKGNNNKVEQNFEDALNDSNNEEEYIDIDPEQFRAWQQAHAESEESNMEQQMKSQSTCCSTSFILLIICLIVGKLEKAYPTVDELPGNPGYEADVGYNAFWILFPIFVITGGISFCCSCLIYGVGRPKDGPDPAVFGVVRPREGDPNAAASPPEHDSDIKEPHTSTHDTSDPTKEVEPRADFDDLD